MMWGMQPSKTSASCILWQPTSNEKNLEDYVIPKELPKKVNEHLLKLNWLHKVLCCQEHYYLLSSLLVLALSSLPLRPVGSCWAGKTFMWIIKSRARLLFVLGCWEKQFCLKQLVLMYSITQSLLSMNLAPDFSLESGCGFWSCSVLEAFYWGMAPDGFYTWTLHHAVLPTPSSTLRGKPQAMRTERKQQNAQSRLNKRMVPSEHMKSPCSLLSWLFQMDFSQGSQGEVFY